MATGAEMVMKSLLKMFGITTADAEREVVAAVKAVLACNSKLDLVLSNQAEIMKALNIRTLENDERRDEQNRDGTGGSSGEVSPVRQIAAGR